MLSNYPPGHPTGVYIGTRYGNANVFYCEGCNWLFEPDEVIAAAGYFICPGCSNEVGIAECERCGDPATHVDCERDVNAYIAMCSRHSA